MTLSFQNVTRRYGDMVALNRVTLEVEPGITALVGPNGSGKSTFMRLATGHAKPTNGSVTAFDMPVWDNPRVMARVGYVPEQDAFYEHMSGIEFVSTLAQLRGASPATAKKRAIEELRELGLDEGLERPIKSYSKGMRQRVKLAQALVHKPKLLLLDEPLLGCDPLARRKIQDRIRAAAKDGAAVLIASHILPDVERLTKRIGFLKAGRLIAKGDAFAIRSQMADVPSKLSIRYTKPRSAAAQMVGWGSVRSVALKPDGIVVETESLSEFLQVLHQKSKNTWGYGGHSVIDGDLSSVFAYLSGGKA